jgi:hypothetical protein
VHRRRRPFFGRSLSIEIKLRSSFHPPLRFLPPPLFTQYQICISSYNRKVGREKVALTCEKTTKKSPQKIAIDQNVRIWMIKKFNTFIDRA